jgi:hypothetical protein
MTTTCPFCGADNDPAIYLPKRHLGEIAAYTCGTIHCPGWNRESGMQSPQCVEAEVARLTKERDEAINARNVIAKNIRAEMILKMQEVAKERDAALARIKRLEIAGDALADPFEVGENHIKAWNKAKEAQP